MHSQGGASPADAKIIPKWKRKGALGMQKTPFQNRKKGGFEIMKNFKKVISAVIALAITVSSFATVSASKFTDVAETAAYAEAVEILSTLGIVNGYAEEDGSYTFRPEGTITRAEAATMIVGALNMTADAQASSTTSQFADVNEKAAWAAGYINVGVNQGFISGMGDGTFAPQDQVTYAQMCVMLTSIAGYGEYAGKNGGWPKGYTDMAASTGISAGVAAANDTAMTRGQVAQMIWNTLQTPMLGVAEYSLTGNTYSQLDGKSDREFKTLLSSKFDTLVVTATITGTAKTSGALENDEATISVTKAAWWDDHAVPCQVLTHAGVHNATVYVDGVDVDANLLQSGKAVIAFDENDDAHLIYFTANTKTETKEFAAEDYVKSTLVQANDRFGDSTGTSAGTGSGKIRFGSKSYTMNLGSVLVPVPSASPVAAPAYVANLYVNGAPATTVVSIDAAAYATPSGVLTVSGGANGTLDQFIGGAQGTVKIVKTDADNGYSSIFVDYYDIAKVVSVSYKNNRTEIAISKASNSVMAANKIIVNDDKVEDGDVKLSVKLDGEDIELKDIQKGDIIAVGIDYAANGAAPTISDPRFLNVLVSRDTVSGKITGADAEEEVYEVDGTEYAVVNYAGTTLNLKDSYTMTLDPFGRIFAAEQEASSTKYAIAEKWTANDELQMLLADGTSKTYALASGVTPVNPSATPITITEVLYGTASPAPAAAKASPQARVVEYTVKNSTGEITSIKQVVPTVITNKEYVARTNKLDSVTVTDATKVVDASKYNNRISEYDTFEGFVDGTKYEAYSYKPAGSTVASFILVTKVGTTFTADSRFAVVTKAAQPGTAEDETDCYDVEVLYGGEATTLQFINNPTGLKVGDAFFFEKDSDNLVTDYYEVYDHASKTYYDFTTAAPSASPVPTAKYDGSTADGWSFNLADEGKDIQLAYAIVTQANGNTVELAAIPTGFGATPAPSTSPVPVIDTNNRAVVTPAPAGAEFLAVDDNAQIYMYDVADTFSISEKDKFSIGTMLASNFSMFETATNSGIYNDYADSDADNVYIATNDEFIGDYAYYALVMIVNGDVVQMYTITK